MYTEGNPKISIVQGDSYTREISFKGIELNLIEKIYFSSCGLNFCKELSKDIYNNVFVLYLSANDTSNFNVGTHDFDLTVQFTNKDVKTIQYKSIISILEKCNKVICYE